MGVSTSVLQWPDLRKSEGLNRFVSPEALSPNHPFWNGLLSYRMKPPKTRSDWMAFEIEVEELSKRLVANNKKSGNFGSLIDVFISRQSELVSSVESESSLFAWQSVNALFLIRVCHKFFVERFSSEDEILYQFEISSNQESPGQIVSDGNRFRTFIDGLVAIITELPDNDQPHTYALRLEAVATMLVCLAAPLFHHKSSWQSSRTLRLFLTLPKATEVTSALLHFYVQQSDAPPMVLGDLSGGSGSLVLGLASGVWNILTLGYGSVAASATPIAPNDEENMMLCSQRPLADMSLLLLLVLVNHGVQDESSSEATASTHPYRNALFNCKGSRDPSLPNTISIDFGKLFSCLRSTLEPDESSTLLLYLLLHRNSDFRAYLFASSDIDLIVVPILKTLYHAGERNNHHIYMSLIILLILTEDDLFNASVHDQSVKGIDWYTERLLGEISLGGLFILVVIRTIQHNMLKMRDKYLHTNCLAALANMSSQFKNLHPYVSQRIVSMFEALAKKYFRLMAILHQSGSIDNEGQCSIDIGDKSVLNDALSDATVLEEVLRMILEIINSCLVAQIKNNPNLIYTLLYKREVFEPLAGHQAYQDLSQNLQTVIHYFSSKLEQVQEKEGSLTVNQIQDFIRQTAMQFPREKLTKFPDLKFRYVEEDQPEDFFVPYTWTLVRRKMFWNPKYVKLPCEPTYN